MQQTLRLTDDELERRPHPGARRQAYGRADTGWPEQQPDIMVLSLTTHKGVQDFAFNKEQALLIAKTIEKTAAQLVVPKTS